jgi:PPP family 3-phenylpropionic acid transporter
VVDRLGIEVVPLGAGLPLILAGLIVWRAPESAAPRMLDWRQAVRGMPWRRIMPVLGAGMLGQASHGPYYAYFTLQMAERGVAPVLIGLLWAWGVVAEIVLMAVSPHLFGRIGLAAALRWALILTLLRWVAFAAEPSLWVVAAAQTLHAASFGMMHLAAVQLVDSHAPPQCKALGQTVLSAMIYGVGVGGGLALAGRLFDQLHYAGLYAGAAVLCVGGLAITALINPRVRRVESAP